MCKFISENVSHILNVGIKAVQPSLIDVAYRLGTCTYSRYSGRDVYVQPLCQACAVLPKVHASLYKVWGGLCNTTLDAVFWYMTCTTIKIFFFFNPILTQLRSCVSFNVYYELYKPHLTSFWWWLAGSLSSFEMSNLTERHP